MHYKKELIMKKTILSVPVVISLGVGLILGSTGSHIFQSETAVTAEEIDFLKSDYIKLMQENEELLENSLTLHEENKMIRDEADKLAGLVEQYQMELSHFIEE
jgi:hypothetical protein